MPRPNLVCKIYEGVTIVDLLIIVALLMGVVSGYRSGVLNSLSHNLGLILGLLAGAALVPLIISWGVGRELSRPLIAIFSLVVMGSLGAAVGAWLGDLLRYGLTRRITLNLPERILGSAVSAVVILLIAGFLGLSFQQTSNQPLRQLLQSSVILQSISARMPNPPQFLAQFEQTFAGLSTPSLSEAPLQLPASVNTAQINAAADSVYRVQGRGCGGLVTGSAYSVGKNYLITNAHV
ncbi:MAG: CvpA family protein, partial [Candidatus Dormibacteraceae bacterium]